MANRKEIKEDNKNIEKEIIEEKHTHIEDNHQSKLIIFIGVIILLIISVFLMKYFFVDKSNIKENYSTDKQLVYIKLEGQDELISTQKYKSTLGYNMRYDIERFKVFKYKEQDIYKFIGNDQVLVVVEKSILPSDCNSEPLETGYNNCYKIINDNMEEYYLTSNSRTYRILVKCPNTSEYNEGVKARIKYMLGSFEIE